MHDGSDVSYKFVILPLDYHISPTVISAYHCLPRDKSRFSLATKLGRCVHCLLWDDNKSPRETLRSSPPLWTEGIQAVSVQPISVYSPVQYTKTEDPVRFVDKGIGEIPTHYYRVAHRYNRVNAQCIGTYRQFFS